MEARGRVAWEGVYLGERGGGSGDSKKTNNPPPKKNNKTKQNEHNGRRRIKDCSSVKLSSISAYAHSYLGAECFV